MPRETPIHEELEVLHRLVVGFSAEPFFDNDNEWNGTFTIIEPAARRGGEGRICQGRLPDQEQRFDFMIGEVF